MDRKKDQFWKHVEKLDCCLNVFKLDCCLKCKFCEHKFDGGWWCTKNRQWVDRPHTSMGAPKE